MALTVAINSPDALFSAAGTAGQSVKVALLVGDAAYATGGYAVTTATFGFGQQVTAIAAYPLGLSGSAYLPIYDPAFKTIRFVQLPSTPTGFVTEVASGTNLTPYQIPVMVWGF